MRFFLAMIPPTTTHQQKQVTVVKGKPRFYEPDDLKAARAKLKAHLAGQVPEAPAQGPLSVTVKWLFPIPAARPTVRDGDWAINAPDCHNLNKLLFDIMTALRYWEDDKQVCAELIQKFWAATPGIFIEIREMEVTG